MVFQFFQRLAAGGGDITGLGLGHGRLGQLRRLAGIADSKFEI
jgi:hypothetical protein